MPTFSELVEALACSPDHAVTDSDLNELKRQLDHVWNMLHVDVEFTRHFLDRVNDARNGKQITVCELARLFMEAFRQYGKKISHISAKEWEAVLADMKTNVNVPFVLKHNGKELTLVAKTVMRKHNFFTPDPKLAVAHYEPKGMSIAENEMKPKTYSDLKEWLGMPEMPVVAGMTNQAIDGPDNAAHEVEDPANFDMLNAYVHELANRQYINPYYPVNELWKKLSMIGINFDVRSVVFAGEQGMVEVPLTQYGGRYGFTDMDGVVKQDDGISHRLPGGLKLVLYFVKTAGVFMVDGKIERNPVPAPFIEGVKPVEEARMPKPKEPATAHLSHEERVKVGLAHAKAKIAYWENIIKDHQHKGENTARAVKYLKRAQSQLQIFQMHQKDLDTKSGHSVAEDFKAKAKKPESEAEWVAHYQRQSKSEVLKAGASIEKALRALMTKPEHRQNMDRKMELKMRLDALHKVAREKVAASDLKKK